MTISESTLNQQALNQQTVNQQTLKNLFTLTLPHSLKHLISHFFQFIFARIILKSFSFLTFPLLTFYIANEEMGFYQLIFGALSIFSELATLGARQHYSIQFFKHNTLFYRLILSGKNLAIYLRISLLFFLGFLALFICNDLYNCNDLNTCNNHYNNSLASNYILITCLAFFQAYLNIFNEFFLSTLRYHQNYKKFNIACVSFGIIQSCIVLYLVVIQKMGLLGMVTALIISEMLQFIYACIDSKRVIGLLLKIKKYRNDFSFRHIAQLGKESIVFIPSVFSFWLLINIDQWMLGSMKGLETVSIYGIASRFPILFDYLFITSFMLIYNPYIYKKFQAKCPNADKINVLISIFVFMMGGLLYYPIEKMSFIVSYVISPNYYESIQYIAPLIIATIFRFAGNILQLKISYSGNIKPIIFINLFAGLLNAILNYILIPSMGINGCLIATVLCFTFVYFASLVIVTWNFGTVGSPIRY